MPTYKQIVSYVLNSTLFIDFKNVFKNFMIYAFQAMANCIKTNYTECSIIMCYFHLNSNIKNTLKLVAYLKTSILKQDITNLHVSLNQIECDKLMDQLFKRWQSDLVKVW